MVNIISYITTELKNYSFSMAFNYWWSHSYALRCCLIGLLLVSSVLVDTWILFWAFFILRIKSSYLSEVDFKKNFLSESGHIFLSKAGSLILSYKIHKLHQKNSAIWLVFLLRTIFINKCFNIPHLSPLFYSFTFSPKAFE